MAQTKPQPQFEDDIADLFGSLRCSSGTTSQPPSPIDPPTKSGSCSLPPPSFLDYPNNTNYSFPSQQNNNHQTALNFHGGNGGDGFLPQQAWNMGYNPEAPVDWSYVNPYTSSSVGTDYYLTPANATTSKKIQEPVEGSKNPSLLGKLTGQEILLLASNQLGSLYLKRILDAATAETMLDRITGRLFDLMNDQYGSYVFQRILLMCRTQRQLEKIVSEVVDERPGPEQLISLAKSKFGSLSIQKLFWSLKKVAPSLIDKVMSAMKPGMLLLMMDVSGRRLIVDCLKHLNHDYNRPIHIVVVNNCIRLAEDNQGYHIVSTVIETIRDAPLRTQLLTTLTQQCVYLAQNPNGNFVLQKVIELQNPSITEDICNNLKPYVVKLSVHKIASHVIEKCLETRGMELLAPELIQSDQVIDVAKDQYGNYIIQKLLEISKTRFYHHIYQKLRSKLVSELEVLLFHPNGKNIIKCL